MKYTVVWKPEAERRPATLWANASDRQAVTVAANWIDARLRDDPENQGESRSGRKRVLLETPLGVLFTVKPEDSVVHVLAIWQFD